MKHLLSNSKIIESVLAKWSDGRYYKVKVLESRKDKRECFVLFEDDTKSWIKLEDLHAQLKADLPEDLIACCVCEDGYSKAPNEIVLCDTCDQGYHKQCHKPTPPEEDEDEDEDKQWHCSTCLAITNANQSDHVTSRRQSKPKKARLDTPACQEITLPDKPSKTAETPKKTAALKKVTPKKARTVKTKAEQKDMSSVADNTPSNESYTVSSTVSYPPNDETRSVEEMHSDLIEAAKDVVVNGFCTKEFVGIVTDNQNSELPSEVKPKSRSRKFNSRTAAA